MAGQRRPRAGSGSSSDGSEAARGLPYQGGAAASDDEDAGEAARGLPYQGGAASSDEDAGEARPASHLQERGSSRERRAPKPKTRSERNADEIAVLEARCQAEAPPPGTVGVRGDGSAAARAFSELPLSGYTLSGLERGKFTRMTRIQQLALPHALAGRDVLGAAQTGSGKTLAFVVPVFEALYRAGWATGAGLGALIISPTRELALQIFEVVRVVGFRHLFAGGLVMGGSAFQREQQHIHHICVMVCTPGRLLQHLEQTPTMDATSVKVLVLDEADRLLDLGFKEQLTQILGYLPKARQTMLFSATQTKSVKALARLSLRRPELVSVLAASSPAAAAAAAGADGTAAPAVPPPCPTPANLLQAYSVCQLPSKLDVLYSFVRSHLQSKTVVFFSSCKQVRFVDAAFRRLRPGVPLMAIHGKIQQQRRLHIYYDFIRKPAAVLFATDVAARGLDFPAVDWVVQVDCPEDTAGYIHRVGRTARYKSKGRALLLLTPNEAEGFLPQLRDANVPVLEKKLNPSKQQSIAGKLASEVARDPELKMNAQRAFKSYLRSVFLQPDKRVFDVKQLPMGAFAQSLGLGNTPRVKLGGADGQEGRAEHRKLKNVPYGLVKLDALMREKEAASSSNTGGAEGQGEGDAGAAAADDEHPQDNEDIMELVEKLKSGRRKKKEEQRKTKWERLLALKAADPVAQSKAAKLDKKRKAAAAGAPLPDSDSDNDREHDRDGLGGAGARRHASGTDQDDGEDQDDDLVLVNTLRPDQEGDGQQQQQQQQQPGQEQPGGDLRDDLIDVTRLASNKQKRRLKISQDGLSKGRAKPQHRTFDESGAEVSAFARLADELGGQEADSGAVLPVSESERQGYLERVRLKLQQEDVDDRRRDKERVTLRHREEKMRLRALARGGKDEEPQATLAEPDEAEDSEEQQEAEEQQQQEPEEPDTPARPARKNKRAVAGSEADEATGKQSKKRAKPNQESMEAAALRLIQQMAGK
jgi:ATP-dependent RNA helicase DDX10/DBP4